MKGMKKQTLISLGLLFLIPVVLLAGGLLFRLINPEMAAGHPNYARNFQILSAIQHFTLLASGGLSLILWLLSCFFMIRSKQRSMGWLFCAALGPIGFAILASLNDRTPSGTDRYARFVRSMNIVMRVLYELCVNVVLWLLAYQAMVLKRNLTILYQSATTGMSTAQIIDQQNASSGMWAFSEGLEVMYLVVLFYLLWPIAFNLVARMAAPASISPETR